MPTRKALYERVKPDPVFRYTCSFKNGEMPSQATLCRFETRLNQNGILEKCFYQLVQNLQDQGVIEGEDIRIVCPPILRQSRS